jgi:anti-sigma regulatory factor (Ser/Thr protein kinase)
MDHEFASVPAAAGIARRAAARALTAWGLTQAQTDTFVLVASELVANAIQAGPRRGFRVRICQEVVGTLTIEVWDPVPTPPCRKALDLYAEDGRGLLIVEQLATHHGWRPTNGGKWVFAVLEVPPHG